MADLVLYDGPENVLVPVKTLRTLIKALEDIGAVDEIDEILKSNSMGFEASVGLVNFIKTYLFKSQGANLVESPALSAIVASATCQKRPDPPVRPGGPKDGGPVDKGGGDKGGGDKGGGDKGGGDKGGGDGGKGGDDKE